MTPLFVFEHYKVPAALTIPYFVLTGGKAIPIVGPYWPSGLLQR